jgi:hypothetical protein
VVEVEIPSAESTIVYFSRFHPNPLKGGGGRRAHQIKTLVEKAGATFQSILDHPHPVPPMTAVHRIYSLLDRQPLLRRLVRDICFWRWTGAFVHSAYNLTRSSWLWALCLDRFPRMKLAIIDDPLLLSPLAKALKKRNIQYVAIVHNLESLASEQVAADYRLPMLERELMLLKDAILAITISREETVLLRNLGMAVCYYPYRPAAENMQRLAAIREKRIESPHRDVLLLGNAFNVATLVGMRQFLSKWNSHAGLSDTRLHVAGFGTEQISEQQPSSHPVVMHGSIAEENLEQLLIHVKGCVCYQPQGSGAMTKIQELIIAGVPVFANEQAARSYYNQPGVYIFEDMHQLEYLINNQGITPPSMHEQLPLAEERRLVDRIRDFGKANQNNARK